jgi:flagellin
MSVVINTNSAASMAANNLSASGAMLQKSLNRLSSGSKIVDPSDDAGGLAVAMKLSAAAKRQGAVSNNIGNTVSFLQAQDGVLKVAGKVLERIGELKTLYADPTKNATDLANYNAEFTQLTAELNSLGAEKFNGVGLFGTSGLTVATTEDGTSTVTSAGVNLLGASPLFAAFTDNFANLSNWTDNSSGGGSRYLNGSAMDLYGNVFGTGAATSLQSFSGPFHLTMNVNITGGGHTFTMKLGATTILSANGFANSGNNTVAMDYDGSGTLTTTLNGVTTTQTGMGVLSGNIAVSNTPNGDALVSNFQIASTNSGNNVYGVANGGSLAGVSLSKITGAIADVATYRADNGATQSRLGYASELISVNKANLEAANSRIMDVDVAAESTTLARYNILTQAGTSMLTQANQASQIALKLLG